MTSMKTVGLVAASVTVAGALGVLGAQLVTRHSDHDTEPDVEPLPDRLRDTDLYGDLDSRTQLSDANLARAVRALHDVPERARDLADGFNVLDRASTASQHVEVDAYAWAAQHDWSPSDVGRALNEFEGRPEAAQFRHALFDGMVKIHDYSSLEDLAHGLVATYDTTQRVTELSPSRALELAARVSDWQPSELQVLDAYREIPRSERTTDESKTIHRMARSIKDYQHMARYMDR